MKKTILIVSFGTSHKDAREHSLERILKEVEAFVRDRNGSGTGTAENDIKVYQAYTSGIILDVLAKKGIQILSVEEAVKLILSDGTEELVVVPTHMIPGIEYHKMLNILEGYRSRFDKLTVTTTVLETQKDCEALVPVLREMLDFKPDTEYILMGHGTEADANIRYEQMNAAFVKTGLANVRIASVEAKPDIEDTIRTLNKVKHKKKISKVLVQPFMVVAGDHAKNDMAGEEDSYVTRLRENGFTVEAVVKGLGEYPQFRKIYLDKIKSIL